jgi:hypothetical protein
VDLLANRTSRQLGVIFRDRHRHIAMRFSAHVG